MPAPVITLIGGPTALIEAGGFRLLTDPTFDAPGDYKLSYVTLKKLSGGTKAGRISRKTRTISCNPSMRSVSAPG